MKFFKKDNVSAEDIDEMNEANDPSVETKDEWVWVDGYKGTDKDMCCRGYQYELGKQFDMDDGDSIELCKSGFHLCLNRGEVYNYYEIGLGNRFFKVKALVRKSDLDTYGRCVVYGHQLAREYKITSRSIIFLSELSADEILRGTAASTLPEQYKELAINISVGAAVDEYNKNLLLQDGYSDVFADFIMRRGMFDIAHAVGSQKDLSMDVRVMTIFRQED